MRKSLSEIKCCKWGSFKVWVSPGRKREKEETPSSCNSFCPLVERVYKYSVFPVPVCGSWTRSRKLASNNRLSLSWQVVSEPRLYRSLVTCETVRKWYSCTKRKIS